MANSNIFQYVKCKCIECHNYMVENSKFFSTQENDLPYSAHKNFRNPLLAYHQKRTHRLQEQFHIQLHFIKKKEKNVTCVFSNKTGNQKSTVMIVKRVFVGSTVS